MYTRNFLLGWENLDNAYCLCPKFLVCIGHTGDMLVLFSAGLCGKHEILCVKVLCKL